MSTKAPKARIYESDVTLNVTLMISEAEARAMLALTAYGADGFLKTFYEHMGESCLKPHEKGLRALFDVIRSEVTPMLARADKARAAFREAAE